MSELSRVELSQVARWDAARTSALTGRCRGKLLGPWGANLTRRFGEDAVARVRGRLPASVAGLPSQPKPKDWFPVAAQICLTEAIVDEFLAGDALALCPLLVQDTERASTRTGLALLRRIGPRGMFKMASRTHKRAYDVGRLDVEVGRGRAALQFRGAAVFGHPTWRLLQVMAQETLLVLAGVEARVMGDDGGADGFSLRVHW